VKLLNGRRGRSQGHKRGYQPRGKRKIELLSRPTLGPERTDTRKDCCYQNQILF